MARRQVRPARPSAAPSTPSAKALIGRRPPRIPRFAKQKSRDPLPLLGGNPQRLAIPRSPDHQPGTPSITQPRQTESAMAIGPRAAFGLVGTFDRVQVKRAGRQTLAPDVMAPAMVDGTWSGFRTGWGRIETAAAARGPCIPDGAGGSTFRQKFPVGLQTAPGSLDKQIKAEAIWRLAREPATVFARRVGIARRSRAAPTWTRSCDAAGGQPGHRRWQDGLDGRAQPALPQGSDQVSPGSGGIGPLADHPLSSTGFQTGQTKAWP